MKVAAVGGRRLRGARSLKVCSLGLGLVAVAALLISPGCDSGSANPEPQQVGGLTPPDDRSAGGEKTFVYWGDNHTHTRFSLDAWVLMHDLVDFDYDADPYQACEYARYCVGLDFFVSTEHAEYLSDDTWDEVRAQMVRCQGDIDATEKKFVAYQGFEWTQVGLDNGKTDLRHFSHRNLHFLNLADPADSKTRDYTTARPIAALDASNSTDDLYDYFTKEGIPHNTNAYPMSEFVEVGSYPECGPDTDPRACRAVALSPHALFTMLDEWRKGDKINRKVVLGGHGTAWGIGAFADWTEYTQKHYSPTDPESDEGYESYIEVYSKHGNSEQHYVAPPAFVIYQDGNGDPDLEGTLTDIACEPDEENPTPGCRCREPQSGERHVPCCWRCYQWVEDVYCKKHPVTCKLQKEKALSGTAGICDALILADKELPKLDWAECGQCPASGAEVAGAPEPLCWKPAMLHVGTGSVQTALAARLAPRCDKYVDDCDPGKDAGCKCDKALPDDPERTYFELGFIAAADTHHVRPGSVQQNREFAEISEAGGYKMLTTKASGNFTSTTQNRSYWFTGGLAAVHVPSTTSDSLRVGIFEAFRRREIFATSGPRIKLWFFMTNPPGGKELPMGSSIKGFTGKPEFRVRAVGALRDLEECKSVSVARGSDFAEAICRNRCYSPDPDDRRAITKIQIIRIERGSSNGQLGKITDPWDEKTCPADQAASEEGCTITFDDEDYGAGPVSYYVRALQEPTLAVNADTVRCKEYDGEGRCVKSEPCKEDESDDCLGMTNERAWSSPIFLYPTAQ